ncbi:MAG: patatin-like phospholipase family protein [Armatimonadota bacterium]
MTAGYTPHKWRCILSIDGGGIRGLLSAMVLAELERRARHPVSRLFHLVAGCSSGSLITLGLARPRQQGMPDSQASDLVRLFEQDSRIIFKRSVLHEIATVHGLFGPRYPTRGLEQVLSGYFGDTVLRDAVTDVLVPCYDLQQRRMVYLTNRDAGYRDFRMRDIALAASAAPVYFPPARLRVGRQSQVLIDAGLFSISPAMSAYAFARTAYPNDTPVLLFSLGAGMTEQPFPFRAARRWGGIGWVGPLQEIVPDGNIDVVNQQLRQLFAAAPGHRYVRMQHPLEQRNIRLDDVRPEHIAELKEIGRQWIEEASETLDELCGLLRENLEGRHAA